MLSYKDWPKLPSLIDLKWSFIDQFIEKRRYAMIANETTLYKRPNDTKINSYRSLYGLQP